MKQNSSGFGSPWCLRGVGHFKIWFWSLRFGSGSGLVLAWFWSGLVWFGWLVGWLVWLVGRLVGWSVGWSIGLIGLVGEL